MREVKQLLATWFLRGEGLEIGALHNPQWVPRQTKVRYVDDLPKAGLMRRYPEVDSSRIVDPDYVADAGSLPIPDKSQDFLIANEVLEHMSNPLAVLSEWIRVVRTRGVLWITIPDKRWTFDRLRPLTSISHLVEDYHATEEELNQRDREAYWEWVRLVDRAMPETEEALFERYWSQRYPIHYHVWTQETFASVLRYARQHMEMPLRVCAAVPLAHAVTFICRKG